MSALFADYHTHPQGHRLRPYTLELLQPWVDSARVRGIRDLAFTDHDRYHPGVDFDVLDRLREKNPEVKIRAGIELDNDPSTGEAGRKWVERNWNRLDFVLGSVHYLHRPDQMFDTVPEGAEQFAHHPIDEIYDDYFRRAREMVETGLVDCLAHIDLVKIHGNRPTRSSLSFLEELLALVQKRGLAIELSTAGWRKPINELYPEDEIIKAARALGCRMTTASDAHFTAQLGENYDRLETKLRELHIGEIATFERHRPQNFPISGGHT